MRTIRDIEYNESPYGYIATIPKGTKVVPATNIPQGGYWAEAWKDMTPDAIAWMRGYGFHIDGVDTDTDILDPSRLQELREYVRQHDSVDCVQINETDHSIRIRTFCIDNDGIREIEWHTVYSYSEARTILGY